MGYIKSVVLNIGWMGVIRVITKFSSLIKITLAARILGPSGFGVFAIASLILAFLEIFTDTGINAILIQEERGLKKYLNTAWLISIIRGIIIFVLIIIIAKPISIFFRQTSSYELILLISISPLIRGFINPAIIKFQKELVFKKELLFRLPVVFVDVSVSILLLLITKNPNSLIWGLIASSFAELTLSLFFIKPTPKYIFNFSQIKQIIRKGKWVTSTGIFVYLFTQGDDWFVGKFFGALNLGLYQVAYKIATLPIYESANIIIRVVFPAYVKIRGDLKRLKKAYIKTTIATSVIVIPYVLLFYIFTPVIISTFLGNEWLSIVSIVRVLLIYALIMSVLGPSSGLFLSLKKQKYSSNIMLVATIVMVFIIIPLAKYFGVLGVAYSVVISWITATILTIYYLFKVFKKDHERT